MTSLTATCSDGFNGGLPQLFLLELQDANNKVCITLYFLSIIKSLKIYVRFTHLMILFPFLFRK